MGLCLDGLAFGDHIDGPSGLDPVLFVIIFGGSFVGQSCDFLLFLIDLEKDL